MRDRFLQVERAACGLLGGAQQVKAYGMMVVSFENSLSLPKLSTAVTA